MPKNFIVQYNRFLFILTVQILIGGVKAKNVN